MTSNHTDFLREAAPYIQLHRGKTFVIAFAGEVIAGYFFTKLVQDIAILSALGARVVIVHGARPQVDAHLKTLNHEINVVDDMRVTDDVTVPVCW